MPYESFHARFPEIAEKETRTLTATNAPDLPKGSFGLVEMYCNEPGCDCRRVFFDVYDWEKRRSMAIIAFGWESEEFYVKWYKYDLPYPEMLQELKGPILNPGSPQSKYAPAFLAYVREILEHDPDYVARLQRHYKMFKETVDGEQERRPNYKIFPSKALLKTRKRKKKTRRGRR
jgi:hypothetical protein